MKNYLLLTIILFGCLSLHAAVFTVQVANYQFTPSTVNAVVGDSITWTWVNGSHTTTSTSVPDGAATWDHNMNSASTSFTYKLEVAGTYNYWCIPHAPDMAGVINVTAVLPVVLLNFTATITQDNKALLKWTVAGEQNTDYYSVQKSTDGKTFSDISRVAASGNSSTQKVYTFTDNNAAASRYVYYALKTVDKDGKTQLSPIVLYKNENIKSGIIVSLSPNPISSPGHLMLQFNADKPGTMLVQLFDMNGKQIKQANMMAVAGINNGHFHLGDLPAGTYTVRFTLDGKTETRRLQFE